MINFSDGKIKQIYIGDTEYTKAYLGNDLVFKKTGWTLIKDIIVGPKATNDSIIITNAFTQVKIIPMDSTGIVVATAGILDMSKLSGKVTIYKETIYNTTLDNNVFILASSSSYKNARVQFYEFK